MANELVNWNSPKEKSGSAAKAENDIFDDQIVHGDFLHQARPLWNLVLTNPLSIFFSTIENQEETKDCDHRQTDQQANSLVGWKKPIIEIDPTEGRK